MAATRKRTLRRVTARGARSVWSECQSRVIESRNSADRLGLPVCERGGSIALHTVRRHRSVAQATCRGTGPGAESGAKAQWGVLGSWESRTVPSGNSRKRMTPAQQRPGAWAVLSKTHASETRGSMRKPAREGNRSEWDGGCGSRSGLVVAFESRVTNRREPVSSKGDRRGRGARHRAKRGGGTAPIERFNLPVTHSLREQILISKNRMR